jgi:hypothetical protein
MPIRSSFIKLLLNREWTIAGPSAASRNGQTIASSRPSRKAVGVNVLNDFIRGGTMCLIRIAVLQAFAFVLIGSTTTCADGFFRRVPEVGEFAVYDAVLVIVFNQGDEPIEIPEYSGTPTLQCVEKTQIDGADFYWIEVLLDLTSPTERLATTCKLLIAAADLVDGDPIANFARGWEQESGAAEPVPLTAESMQDSTSPAPLILRAVFRGSEGESETLEQAQTAAINGNEVRIESAEHGDFAQYELSYTPTPGGKIPFSGWGTWWLHEDAGFGVAAAEQLWTTETHADVSIEYALQFSLKETGVDAVSALPDSE